MQRTNLDFLNKPDSVWFRGHFEICKLGDFTGQNWLECSSYLIHDIKMYTCVKFGVLLQSELHIALAPVLLLVQ